MEEIKAPLGYHKSSDIFRVTVISELVDTPAEVLYIANSTSALLPDTGGIGTYLFVGGGAAIMVAAAVFALRKRKKGSEPENK